MGIKHTDLPGGHTQGVLPPAFAKGSTTAKPMPRGAPRQRHSGQGVRAVEVIDDALYDFYSSSLATGNDAISVAAYNPARRYLEIQNTGGVEILLGFGVTPRVSTNFSETQAIRLPAGTTVSFPARIVPNNDVFAVSSAAGSLTVLEGIVSQS